MKNQVIPWFLLHGRDFGRGFQGDRRFPKSHGHSHHQLICVAWSPSLVCPQLAPPNQVEADVLQTLGPQTPARIVFQCSVSVVVKVTFK